MNMKYYLVNFISHIAYFNYEGFQFIITKSSQDQKLSKKELNTIIKKKLKLISGRWTRKLVKGTVTVRVICKKEVDLMRDLGIVRQGKE